MRSIISKIVPLISFIYILHLIFSRAGNMDFSPLYNRPDKIVLSVALTFLMLLVAYGCWHTCLQRKVPILTPRESYRMYALSLMQRYLPGGQLWQYVGFFQSGNSLEISTLAATVYAQCTLGGFIAGAILGFFGLKELFPSLPLMAVPSLIVLTLIAMRIACAQKWQQTLFDLARKRFPKLPQEINMKFSDLAFCVFAGLIGWILSGLIILVFYWCLHNEANWNLLLPILRCYSIATLAAYFTFLTPGGIGIREGLFVALLSRYLPLAECGFLALGLAFNIILCDIIFSFPALMLARRAHSAEILNSQGK